MPNFPVKFGNTIFKYRAVSPNSESLIKVIHGEEEFFIQVVEQKDGFLIKNDKITRPSQVVFVQQALRDFRDLCGCEAFYSNIEPQKIRNKTRYDAIKNIDFFMQKFTEKKDIWIEIGFGSGRHLLYQAKNNKEIQFIGIEIHKPSIEQVAKQCEIQNIDNIFLLDYDARIFLEFLESNSVGKIFVHFPVPWDKKPHRRVISYEFIKEAIKVLKQDGKIELRTDSRKYFDYATSEFLKFENLNIKIHKNRNLDISSKYEDRWKRQDKDIFDISFSCEDISEYKTKISLLKFDTTYKFENVKSSFQKKVENHKEFFLHVEKFYEINDKEGLLKLSFGSSSKNERVYVQFLKESTSYFPNSILNTKANKMSHDLFIKWLNEKK